MRLLDQNVTHVLSRYLFFLVAVMVTSSDPVNLEKDLLQGGMLVLSDGKLSQHPYELNGYWEFYPNELIGSDEMDAKAVKDFIEVPFWWTEEADLPYIQTATYRLKVIHSKTHTSSLAISMPDVYCSYDLWVNGRKLGQNGTVAKTKTETKPQWKPDTYIFTAEPDTLEIILAGDDGRCRRRICRVLVRRVPGVRAAAVGHGIAARPRHVQGPGPGRAAPARRPVPRDYQVARRPLPRPMEPRAHDFPGDA